MVTTNLLRNTLTAALAVIPFAGATVPLRKVMYYDEYGLLSPFDEIPSYLLI